ncbi:unnamed protein product, partial [Ilex paraguariensis]
CDFPPIRPTPKSLTLIAIATEATGVPPPVSEPTSIALKTPNPVKPPSPNPAKPYPQSVESARGSTNKGTSRPMELQQLPEHRSE